MKPKSKKAQKARALSAQKQRAAERDASGRVHLTLHRDPQSGSPRVTLDAPLFKEEWQNEITAGAANTAVGILRDAPSVTRAIELGRNAMAAASKLSEGLLARAPAGAVACKAGCDHCCYQAVGVTPPEALAIFDHLKKTRSASQRTELAKHIAERYEKTRGLTSSERFSPEHPCPFLDVGAGQCTIYEARPLACRGMNSLDAGECKKRLRESEARADFLANGSGSHAFMEPIRAFHAISAGLQLSLSELYQLDMRPLELTAALQLLFTLSESTPGEWIRGQSPFESAVVRDKAGERGLRELSGTLEPAPDEG